MRYTNLGRCLNAVRTISLRGACTSAVLFIIEWARGSSYSTLFYGSAAIGYGVFAAAMYLERQFASLFTIPEEVQQYPFNVRYIIPIRAHNVVIVQTNRQALVNMIQELVQREEERDNQANAVIENKSSEFLASINKLTLEQKISHYSNQNTQTAFPFKAFAEHGFFQSFNVDGKFVEVLFIHKDKLKFAGKFRPAVDVKDGDANGDVGFIVRDEREAEPIKMSPHLVTLLKRAHIKRDGKAAHVLGLESVGHSI